MTGSKGETLSTRKSSRKAALGCAAVAASAALVLTGLGTAHAETGDELPADSGSRSRTTQDRVTQSELDRMETQRKAGNTALRVAKELGTSRSGGGYLDAASGKPIVTVTDSSDADYVAEEGAEARSVTFSTKELTKSKDTIDSLAKSKGAGQVQSWGIDPRTNSVVVTTPKGATDKATTAFLEEIRAQGKRVTVQESEAQVMATAGNLYGGQEVNMSSGFTCSAGFNTRKKDTGRAVLLTAGHCAEGRPTFSRFGVSIGGTMNYSFPGNDYAAVAINETNWIPRGGVDKYDGYARLVKGSSGAAVGTPVCKSGRTTGWTCGYIQSYNNSVNYGGGDIVKGLVKNNACVQQGDSGGSNISGNLAQGITSGGGLYQDPSGNLVCGEKVGQPNESYYQPINEVLQVYNLALITQ